MERLQLVGEILKLSLSLILSGRVVQLGEGWG